MRGIRTPASASDRAGRTRDFLKANPPISDEIEGKVREKLGVKNVHVLPPAAEVPDEMEEEHAASPAPSAKKRG